MSKGRVYPTVVASHFASDVILSIAGCVSIINVVNANIVRKFPSDPNDFSIFVSVTGGRGSYNLLSRFLFLETGKVLWSADSVMRFDSPLETKFYSKRLTDIVFPAGGLYVLEVLFDKELVLSRGLTVRGLNDRVS